MLSSRYVSFDPLGNWLLTGISNTPGTSAYFTSGTTASSSLSGPSTLGPAQVPSAIPVSYRIERNEQERERNLQSRYQVSFLFIDYQTVNLLCQNLPI